MRKLLKKADGRSNEGAQEGATRSAASTSITQGQLAHLAVIHPFAQIRGIGKHHVCAAS